MSTTTTRQTLAMQACAGMSDAELQERGLGSFAAMRDRKRWYAQKARVLGKAAVTLDATVKLQDKKIAQLQAQFAELQAKYEALLNLDAPVSDTSAAQGLLAQLAKKGGA